MLIDVKYAVNDKVKFKFNKTVTSTCTCGFCGATGRIRGFDGSEEDCPRCDGRGYTEIISGQDVILDGTIKEIRIKWKRSGIPHVYYIMMGWEWSTTEIPQEDIVEDGVVIINSEFEKKLP